MAHGNTGGMGFLDDAEKFAGGHDKQVDEGLQMAGNEVDKRTGDKYSGDVNKAVSYAQQHTGGGDSYDQQGQGQGGYDQQ